MADSATLAGVRTLRNYVGGEWRTVAAQETIEDRNPATGELLAYVPLSGAADVDAAVAAARDALPAWRATSPLVRARALFDVREVLDRERGGLAALVTADM